MASRRSDVNSDAWVRAYGEKLGAQLGEEIAASIKRTIEAKLDFSGLASRGGGRKSKGGGCTGEAGCPDPVLAKGLCRSHYYKARYKTQKGGAKPSRRK